MNISSMFGRLFAVLVLSVLTGGVANAQMGQYGMGMMGGPGMMGGCGYGMMGGSGMMGMGMHGMGGSGMMGMGMHGMGMVGLSDAQQEKMRTIRRETRKAHFALMEKIMGEQEKLADLYGADRPDSKKIGAVYGRMFAMQRQMIESRVDAHNRMEALLTKEQREHMQQWRQGMGMWGRGGMGTRGDMHGGGMMR